jgi:phosphoribosylaminoimidazole (AIR) synthetase
MNEVDIERLEDLVSRLENCLKFLSSQRLVDQLDEATKRLELLEEPMVRSLVSRLDGVVSRLDEATNLLVEPSVGDLVDRLERATSRLKG